MWLWLQAVRQLQQLMALSSGGGLGGVGHQGQGGSARRPQWFEMPSGAKPPGSEETVRRGWWLGP